MNERQLESFIRAAQLGSITKAAAASFISAPALLQQIELLERDLGFKLLARSHRGVTPTKAGEHFLEAAQSILAIYAEARAFGQAVEEGFGALIRIAAPDNEPSPFLLDLCRSYRQIEPHVLTKMQAVPYSSQLDALRAGLIDVAFLPRIDGTCDAHEDALTFHPLYSDPYVCCVAPSSPLAQRTTLTARDLVDQQLYLETMYRDEPSMAVFLAQAQAEGVALHLDDEPFNQALPADIAMDGGALPIPRRYSRACCPPLTAIPLDCAPATYGAYTRSRTTAVVEAFVDFAHAFLSDEAFESER